MMIKNRHVFSDFCFQCSGWRHETHNLEQEQILELQKKYNSNLETCHRKLNDEQSASFDVDKQIKILKADLSICKSASALLDLPDQVRSDISTFEQFSSKLRGELESALAAHQTTLKELDASRQKISLNEAENQNALNDLNRKLRDARLEADTAAATERSRLEAHDALRAELDAAKSEARKSAQQQEEALGRLREELDATRKELGEARAALRGATDRLQASPSESSPAARPARPARGRTAGVRRAAHARDARSRRGAGPFLLFTRPESPPFIATPWPPSRQSSIRVVIQVTRAESVPTMTHAYCAALTGPSR